MESILGSVILEFIGAYTKWLTYKVFGKFKGRKTLPFKLIWKGRKKAGEEEYILQGWSNIIVGILVILIICLILVVADFD